MQIFSICILIKQEKNDKKHLQAQIVQKKLKLFAADGKFNGTPQNRNDNLNNFEFFVRELISKTSARVSSGFHKLTLITCMLLLYPLTILNSVVVHLHSFLCIQPLLPHLSILSLFVGSSDVLRFVWLTVAIIFLD